MLAYYEPTKPCAGGCGARIPQEWRDERCLACTHPDTSIPPYAGRTTPPANPCGYTSGELHQLSRHVDCSRVFGGKTIRQAQAEVPA